MAQNGPRGHQVDDGHSASGMGGKNVIPDLNMEDCESESEGGSKDKRPRSEVEAEAVQVPAAGAGADADKGKSVAAADDGKLSVNIALERERRKRMNGLFRALQDLMPHVPEKTDKVTIVEEAIEYIKALEVKAAMLGKQTTLARQAAAAASFPLTAMPQTAQGMATRLCSSNVPRGWGGVPVPPAAPAVPPSSVRMKTWSAPNVVLTVANDNAYISVLAPRRPNTLTMVTSVLDNHGIDVITAQISSDRVFALYIIFAHLGRVNGANRSSEEVYQRAVSEIMLRLNSNN